MADLNDFFAKKDKKKASGLKFSTVNEIDKRLEEAHTKKEKTVKKKSDPEWKEFEEKKKDYTGLKIQNIEGSSEENEVEDEDEEEECREDTICPWNIIENKAEKDDIDESKKSKNDDEESADENGSVWVNAYIPPHLRKKQMANPHKSETIGELNDSKWPLISSATSHVMKAEGPDSSELRMRGKKSNLTDNKYTENATGDSNKNNPTKVECSNTNKSEPVRSVGQKYVPPHLRAKTNLSRAENEKNN